MAEGGRVQLLPGVECPQITSGAVQVNAAYAEGLHNGRGMLHEGLVECILYWPVGAKGSVVNGLHGRPQEPRLVPWVRLRK